MNTPITAALIVSLAVSPLYAVTGHDYANSRPRCQTKPVIMYMTTWCGYCRDLRAFFERHLVQYHEVDAQRSGPGAYEIFRQHGVPYTQTQSGWIAGADKEAFRATLCIR